MMRELRDEEKEFLVNYCMESDKNIWLALAIGQLQPELKTAIVFSFLKKLDKSVERELKERGLHCQWDTRIPKINLEVQDDCIYMVTMKDPEIEIHLIREKNNLFVGTPAANGTCPQAEDLASFFEDTDLDLETHDYWRWWFYPEPSHKSFESLSTLHDGELRCNKIAYFTDMLVRPAEAISKVLGA